MSSTALSSPVGHGLDFSAELLRPRPVSQESDRIRCYTARAINRAIDMETDHSRLVPALASAAPSGGAHPQRNRP